MVGAWLALILAGLPQPAAGGTLEGRTAYAMTGLNHGGCVDVDSRLWWVTEYDHGSLIVTRSDAGRLSGFSVKPGDVAHGGKLVLDVDARRDSLYLGQKSVLRYSLNGRLKGAMTTFGDEPGQTSRVISMAHDRAGNLFVLDEAPKVLKLGADGELLKAWGRQGTGPGELDRPSQIAADARGHLFVVDRRRLQEFDNDGRWLREWQHQGDDNGPRPCWSVATGPNGVLYWADHATGRVSRMAWPNAESRTAAGVGSGLMRTERLAGVDGQGRIYLISADAVHMFQPAGPAVVTPAPVPAPTIAPVAETDPALSATGQAPMGHVATWGTIGRGRLQHPCGAVLSAQGHLLVLDRGCDLVEFDAAGRYVRTVELAEYTVALGNNLLVKDTRGRMWRAHGETLWCMDESLRVERSFNLGVGRGDLRVCPRSDGSIDLYSGYGESCRWQLGADELSPWAEAQARWCTAAVIGGGVSYRLAFDGQSVWRYDERSEMGQLVWRNRRDAGLLTHAADLAVSPAGDLLVLDSGVQVSYLDLFADAPEFAGACVHRVSLSGSPIEKWGSATAAEGGFPTPVALVVGADGVCYVANAQPPMVQVWAPGGAKARPDLVGSGQTDTPPPPMYTVGARFALPGPPWCLARDRAGRLYASEIIAKTLMVLAADGTPLPSLPLPGLVSGVEHLVCDRQDRLWVVDSGCAAVHGYSLDGQRLFTQTTKPGPVRDRRAYTSGFDVDREGIGWLAGDDDSVTWQSELTRADFASNRLYRVEPRDGVAPVVGPRFKRLGTASGRWLQRLRPGHRPT